MITYERIKTICDPDGAPIYQQPWTTPDGKTAATEGHVMVLVDAVFPETPERIVGAAYPNCDLYFASTQRNTRILDTSGVCVKASDVDCPECKGTGKFSPCPECDGEGRHACSCGLDHECGACDGTGVEVGSCDDDEDAEDCGDCDGTGTVVKYDPVDIQGYLFRGDLLEKIMALPGFRCLATVPGGYAEPATFEFDGGKGVIMPMTKD